MRRWSLKEKIKARDDMDWLDCVEVKLRLR